MANKSAKKPAGRRQKQSPESKQPNLGAAIREFIAQQYGVSPEQMQTWQDEERKLARVPIEVSWPDHFVIWLKANIDRLECALHNPMILRPAGRQREAETPSSIVKDAHRISRRFGHLAGRPPELGGSYTATEAIVELKKLLTWIEKATAPAKDAATPEPHPKKEGEEPTHEPRAKRKKPSLAQCRAYESYVWVAGQSNANSLLDDGCRYTWRMWEYVKENAPQYHDEDGKPLKMPGYESWKRYIRGYEQIVDGPKNTPWRPHTSGRSIVKASELADARISTDS